MVSTTAILCVLSSLIVLGSSCTVKSTSYTTEDLQVISNSISFIAEFSLKCPNQIDNMPLFAVLPNGRIAYVFRVGDKYQLSWSEDIKTAKSGTREVRLFDEEGFSQLRKAQRSNENIEKIKSLSSLNIKYKGSFSGNFLINSEFMALASVMFVAYVAFQNRMKLMN
ncbi:unnamed protein product [Diamesa hyperborea]